MKYVILENNIVVNIIEASQEFITESELNAELWVDGLNIGDTYINGQITKAEPPDEIIQDVEISRLKIALYRHSMLAGINSYMASKNGETQIWWENVKSVSFYHEKVQNAITELELDVDFVKDLFKLASTIE